MPEALKKLGQVNSTTIGANVDANMYINATTLGFACSSIVVCNTTGAAITYRVYSYAGADANMTTATALVYDKSLPANSTDVLQLGIVGVNADKLGVRAGAVGVTFTAYGAEES